MKDKTIAGVIALFLGSLGIHKFYLNKPGKGILYFIFSWTTIPFWLGLIEGVQYLTMSQEGFDYRYNRQLVLPHGPPPRQQITDRPSHKSLNPYQKQQPKKKVGPTKEEQEQLRGLKGLLDDNAITQEEFNEIKADILGTKKKRNGESFFDYEP